MDVYSYYIVFRMPVIIYVLSQVGLSLVKPHYFFPTYQLRTATWYFYVKIEKNFFFFFLLTN